METKSIMPEIHIGLGDLAHAAWDGLKKVLTPTPTEAPLHMSNHYVREHFVEPTQPQLPFEPQTPTADFYPPFIDRSRA